jgi:dipeptidyl aminopeptidase/acylaminoacyl peptidase
MTRFIRLHPVRKLIVSLSISLVLCGLEFSQNLTVREIMAEPSIAGMRVEGEKLSPDGSKVIYLWNAEGKMPRDLYLVATSGGTPQKILSVSDLPVPSRTPEKENKLNYGLDLRDQFVKDRENQLGSFEWSPDSKRLVFSYGGDLYVLDVPATVASTNSDKAWQNFEDALRNRSEYAEALVGITSQYGDRQIDDYIITYQKRLQDVFKSPLPRSEIEKQNILNIYRKLETVFEKAYYGSLEPILKLKDDNRLNTVLTSFKGSSNRVHVALHDYEESVQTIKPRRLTQTQTTEVGLRFLDNDRLLYSQNGNLFTWNLTNNLITQISKEADQQKFISVTNATPNKVGSLVAYVVSDNSKQRALVVPNYLDEFVQASNVRRGWSDQKVLVTVTDGSRDAPFEIKLPKAEGVANIRSLSWAAGGRSLVIDRVDKDTKRRQLFYVYNVGAKDEQIILVTEETDDKWQAPLSAIVEPNPKDDSELVFGSERDGFNHLYLAKLEQAETRAVASVQGEQVATSSAPRTPTGKVNITQLTKGNWQVEWAKWTDGKMIVYASTEPHFVRLLPQHVGYLERQLHLILSDGSSIIPPSHRPGMRSGFQISENVRNPFVLFDGSAWNEPDELFAEQISNPEGKEIPGFQGIRQLTHTTPKAFESLGWIAPKFLEISSRDNKKIPAKIYLPTGFDKTKKYPMVIFVHGAGYLQNTINGWNNYYREFMFNELLTQKGYVVLDIDYRGSAGYGREWRTDVYDFVGGKDYEDELDALDFMIKNYAVDAKHVGVYGGSYGGFMAEMLAFRAPEKIAAAAALRPVADWKNYYASSPGYTAQRLGFPDKNPEAYRRSSPITYADGLKTHLLILHGMSDTNVHVQDSVQLVEKLIRLGKTQYFETMFYPSENHGFERPESWIDEYERILAFFEKYLKN